MRLRDITIFALASLLHLSMLHAGDEGLPGRPNDPYFGYQTALGESEGAVTPAWDITRDASSVIVAVIDTGTEWTHPDLEENIWINSGEVPDNGVDDDGNGYADDVHGYDFRNNDGDPEDGWGHGTLTAGIIGAVGNNGVGISGVAWSVQLMILKVFGDSGGGRISDFVEAVRYAVDNGASVISAAWTIPPSEPGDEIPLLRETFEAAREAGIFVAAAAGNDGQDLDESPVFPAAYALDNLVSVAALQEGSKSLLSLSNYGHETVNLAAPGEHILGTYLSQSYGTLTGTSSATALVSGVAALIRSERPDLSPQHIRNLLLTHSDLSESLQDITQSGGALNSYSSLSSALTADPNDAPSEETGTEGEGGATEGVEAMLEAGGGCSLIAGR